MDEYVIKILTLGDSGVGKTSIIQKFVNDKFNQNMLSTIGVDFQSKEIIINNTKIKLKIWDTTGQERFKTLTSQYYNGADGALLIFDVTSKLSFERINFWINELKEKKKLNELGLLLIGNKIDLNEKRNVKKEEAEEFAKEYNINYYETSALQNINIKNIINDIAQQCLNKIQKNDEFYFQNSLNEKKMIIDNISNNKKKKCC
jgi:small GTP-binding protein